MLKKTGNSEHKIGKKKTFSVRMLILIFLTGMIIVYLNRILRK